MYLWVVLVTLVGYGYCDDFDVIYSHLKDMEGYKTTGYIPTAGSGVTIATGVDLGQQSESGLKSLGVPNNIINKVKPYLGLKTRQQVEAKGLKAANLKLTDAEAKSLDLPFTNKHISAVKPYTSKMTVKGTAVLVSLRHWAGALGNSKNDGKLAMPKNGKVVNYVWNAIEKKTATNNDLKQALSNTLPLHTKGTAAYNRINREISYL